MCYPTWKKDKNLYWVYILKPNYRLVHDLRKGEHSRAQEMGLKLDFSANRWIFLPLARESILFMFNFISVNLIKNHSFGVFKIKKVFEFKF